MAEDGIGTNLELNSPALQDLSDLYPRSIPGWSADRGVKIDRSIEEGETAALYYYTREVTYPADVRRIHAQQLGFEERY